MDSNRHYYQVDFPFGYEIHYDLEAAQQSYHVQGGIRIRRLEGFHDTEGTCIVGRPLILLGGFDEHQNG